MHIHKRVTALQILARSELDSLGQSTSYIINQTTGFSQAK